MDDKLLLSQLAKQALAARKQRPDAAPEDLLFRLFGDPKAETFEEANAEQEEFLFVCLRCSAGEDNVVPGSTRERCATCGEEVWMSPATKASLLRLDKTRVKCVQCLLPETGA